MKRWRLVLCCVLGCVCCANAWAATNVRGRVDVNLQYGVVPMTGATVSLCFVGQGCTDYVTGADGMYYFTAAAGEHLIKVNGAERLRLVIPDQQQFDVEPIKVN